MAMKVGKPKANSEIAVRKTGARVATAGNPWSQLALELEKHLGASTLKFTKDGVFALSETESVPDGTKCVARVNLVQTGWKKWLENLVERTVIGAVADGFVPPTRAALGDTDENRWDRDASGTPRDPWRFCMVLPVTRLDTDETVNFVTGSKGGLNAVNKLIRTYGTRVARGQTGLPVVELKADFYKHREYGKIYYPKFLVTTWTDDGGGKPLPIDKDLNDQIPL
jgi:hypothetical protein